MSLQRLTLLLGLPLLLASCSQVPFMGKKEEAIEPAASQANAAEKPAFVNPHPEGTYEHFKAEPNYKKTYNVYRNHELLNAMTPESASLNIDLSDQRAQLLHNGQVAMDYPVATGRSSHPTPAGSYTILEKMKDKRSNAYGRIVDADGNVVNSDADSRKDKVPPGGKFIGASMPYWMRFTWTGVGHHIGNVPRYPASHGCIRGKRSTVPEVFSKVKVGTPVTIVQ
ncbi:L,D-transpeptidase [Roseibacillus ishigakijimensis]|uniref:L,D-transpeptidase n=1 Tax=Roseibacillus ishigakijimensis TaxID=454146 RepID=A0A934RP70_9BACT|nr:L,D-transpeptidase [Roseibacillus ishigakijimensis]MBK1834974.1 L,D-transpeptidase [Roseibacillus ishigakijimensis]